MDPSAILETISQYVTTGTAVAAVGTGLVAKLSEWWWGRPRMIAIYASGGRKAWRQLPKAERRRRIRAARSARD